MSMDEQALTELLHSLIERWESEVVEFKRGGKGFSTSDLGKYLSALANEANLRACESAWLVFGIDDKTRRILGSEYRQASGELDKLKMQIADGTEPSITFRDIHELQTPEGRVLLFEIPPAPMGMPIAWHGHYYARAGESLTSLGLDKLDTIRRQTDTTDWSVQLVPDATLDHLDPEAVAKARESFAKKYANRFEPGEVMGWPLATFLDRAKLTLDGKMTRAALLLLGKAAAVPLLSPHPAQLTWKLEGAERAYQHFGPPFLLATTQLYQRIRNIQLRLLPQDELVPIEVSKYDQKIVLEALHNCIAHQDYSRNARVVVIEQSDRLVFDNEGSFFEGEPGDYLEGHRVPKRYRNPFLTQAMAELNMIDTMGYGIHDMYSRQARRYLPLPDYDLSKPGAVRLTVHGGVVDSAYSRLLIQQTDLALVDVLALDRIQKQLPIADDAVTRLRRAGLIEGRKPNYHVSASVADATATKAQYIHTRGQDDAFYAKLVTDYLAKFGSANRREIDTLLWDKLSDALDEQKKKAKVGNILTKLRRAGRIRNAGSRSAPEWRLAEADAERSAERNGGFAERN
ncbi:RNA-binding domain-containing protein [Alloalcanivorax profundimaris]|uniref:RNA-binding domain-containing protein n=1 Tax=Alloalcanivorax profundimaris TaxID=2735259 RepID=UPI001E426767|nr:RNA-binding domain-containing protein [Alloalcanivorax profundimaris]